MKRNIILLLFLWMIFYPAKAQDTIIYKFWISFTDKNETPFGSGNPEQFLSERAIERRTRYNIPVTESDLPVNPAYTDSLRKLGAHLLYTSKWFNAAVIETVDSSLVQMLNQQSFISHTELLYRSPYSDTYAHKALVDHENIQILEYGLASQQIMIHHADRLHGEGYLGQGMHIAILDAGFLNVDSLRAFDSLRINGQILGTRDFVKAGNNVYREHSHGMKVLSLMGGNIPDTLIGTAPKANFWLLRSEDVGSEYRIEEANWIAAAEFADSVGSDVINSSLGYSLFDDSLQNYTYEDMDGHTTLVTRGADMAASKGILVVVSAGNEGNKPWRYITAPADGNNVLTVGAIKPDGTYATFSSQGPTSDKRIKPNVVAIGQNAYVQNINGTVGPGSGTSFSSPIIAGLASCLWQKFRDISNDELIYILEQSSSKHTWPDYLIGYGIPNLGVANDLITGKYYQPSGRDLVLYPNPVKNILCVSMSVTTGQILQWEMYDASGRKIRSSSGNIDLTGTGFSIDALEELNPGLYIIKITTDHEIHSGRFIKE
jgi:serine protease AprX